MCKEFHQLPSQRAKVVDEWAAYQFDVAVRWLGTTIENALQVRQEIGMGPNKRSEPRYRLEQLLDPDFRLPAPAEARQGGGLAALLALAGKARSGVRLWKQKPSD